MSGSVEKRVALIGTAPEAARMAELFADFPELVPAGWIAIGCEGVERPLRNLERFERLEQLLQPGRVPDIAILCGPPGERQSHALPLLRAGVDLLVLAPLATRPQEAERLLEIAERTGRELTTAMPHRLSPSLREAREILREGQLGLLRYVECTLSEKRDAGADWRADPELSGGGIWMQLGPGAIDVLELLLGPIQRIRMLELRQRQRAGIEDEVMVETDHGAVGLGRIRLSWNEELTNPLVLCACEHGELAVGRSQTILRSEAGEQVVGGGYDDRAAWCAVMRDHLRRRCILDPPIDTGPESVSWIESAYRSLPGSRWQS